MKTAQFSGSKRRLAEKQDSYQYIPLLRSLEALLGDKSIQEQVQNLQERIHTDGKMEDNCDGARFRSHPLFSETLHALQIIAHYDEIELCNPLGSHVKRYKVGLLSYTLRNIQLVIVASIPVIEKHGLPLNIFATKGIKINIDGALLALCWQIIWLVMGLKKSFPFLFAAAVFVWQHRILSMPANFYSEAYQKRNDKSHSKHLKEIESDVTGHYSFNGHQIFFYV